jgi:Asp-tRNA(Asn)/Glu-tRNA(Gln) amidotransferase A subunit family amidase
VEVEIPNLAERVRGFYEGARHEFKWELMAYLSAMPEARVASLGDIHEYREAMAKRPPLKAATVALLDSLRLDALVYPVVRRRPALLGEEQGGSTCILSAVTGLPALAVPAGLTRQGSR